MATVVESKKLMDDTLDFVRVVFTLAPETEEDNTLAKRLRCQVEYRVTRDDGKPGRGDSQNYRVEDAEVPEFSAGDAAALRALLKKLYDSATVSL